MFLHHRFDNLLNEVLTHLCLQFDMSNPNPHHARETVSSIEYWWGCLEVLAGHSVILSLIVKIVFQEQGTKHSAGGGGEGVSHSSKLAS